MQVSKLVSQDLRLTQVITIFFINLNLYRESIKIEDLIKLAVIALLDLTNDFSQSNQI